MLKSLLPETNSDIKGRMRSSQDLLGLRLHDRASDFHHLIRILDSDLRLITPVDLEGSLDDGSAPEKTAGGRYYQLTHDYLVHSLRDWLTRKQK